MMTLHPTKDVMKSGKKGGALTHCCVVCSALLYCKGGKPNFGKQVYPYKRVLFKERE